ncbi:unnamed protein product, partial [Bubo scandiacus]
TSLSPFLKNPPLTVLEIYDLGKLFWSQKSRAALCSIFFSSIPSTYCSSPPSSVSPVNQLLLSDKEPHGRGVKE